LFSRRFHGVVDLIQSRRLVVVLEDLDQFKGSMATTSTLGSGVVLRGTWTMTF
jgi:hypothetical protein